MVAFVDMHLGIDDAHGVKAITTKGHCPTLMPPQFRIDLSKGDLDMAEYKWLEPVTITPKRVIKKVERVGPAKSAASDMKPAQTAGWYSGLPWPEVKLNVQVPKFDFNAVDPRGRAKSVMGEGSDVYYQYEDGTIDRQSGGTLSWRNNNPGNLITGPFAERHGAIGSNRGKAVFPDYETGWKAMRDLIVNNYGDHDLQSFARRYAPKEDGNDPDKYARDLARAMNIPVNSVIKTFSQDQFVTFLDSIQKREGYRFGERKSWP